MAVIVVAPFGRESRDPNGGEKGDKTVMDDVEEEVNETVVVN